VGVDQPAPYSRGYEPILHRVACKRGLCSDAGITLYEVEVVHGANLEQTLNVYCRFSKFITLTKLLADSVEEMPPLPAKTAALHGAHDAAFVERRVAGLDDFLKMLLHAVPDTSKCAPLLEFLNLVPGWGT